jgi:LytS/YehU family sensor histidine kinase
MTGDNPIKLFVRIFVRYIPAALAVVLLSIVFRLFSQKIAKEKQEIVIQNEQLLSEMKFLKSQVNPHFLFNALNNIYTLVHLKHENAPTMLIKLSDMLRYMLYECNDEWVNLEKEVAYINNYIELQ